MTSLRVGRYLFTKKKKKKKVSLSSSLSILFICDKTLGFDFFILVQELKLLEVLSSKLSNTSNKKTKNISSNKFSLHGKGVITFIPLA